MYNGIKQVKGFLGIEKLQKYTRRETVVEGMIRRMKGWWSMVSCRGQGIKGLTLKPWVGGWRLNCELKSASIPNAYLNTIHYPVHVESTGLRYSGVEGSAGRGGGSVESSSTKLLNSNRHRVI